MDSSDQTTLVPDPMSQNQLAGPNRARDGVSPPSLGVAAAKPSINGNHEEANQSDPTADLTADLPADLPAAVLQSETDTETETDLPYETRSRKSLRAPSSQPSASFVAPTPALADKPKKKCVCGHRINGSVWICCSSCSQWYHCGCVSLGGLDTNMVKKIRKWECYRCFKPACEPASVVAANTDTNSLRQIIREELQKQNNLIQSLGVRSQKLVFGDRSYILSDSRYILHQ